MMKVKYVGQTGFGRPVYEDEKGRLYIDKRIASDGILELYTGAVRTGEGCFGGEPDEPVDEPAFCEEPYVKHPEHIDREYMDWMRLLSAITFEERFDLNEGMQHSAELFFSGPVELLDRFNIPYPSGTVSASIRLDFPTGDDYMPGIECCSISPAVGNESETEDIDWNDVELTRGDIGILLWLAEPEKCQFFADTFRWCNRVGLTNWYLGLNYCTKEVFDAVMGVVEVLQDYPHIAEYVESGKLDSSTELDKWSILCGMVKAPVTYKDYCGIDGILSDYYGVDLMEYSEIAECSGEKIENPYKDASELFSFMTEDDCREVNGILEKYRTE